MNCTKKCSKEGGKVEMLDKKQRKQRENKSVRSKSKHINYFINVSGLSTPIKRQRCENGFKK